MLLTELFETWDKAPLFIAIATNGLDAKKDKVLGVAAKNADMLDTVLLRETHGEDLMKAQKYHQITDELMYQAGLPDSDFIESVSTLLKDRVLFSYNTPFQYAFLSVLLNEPSLMLYDLSVVEQAIRKGLAFSEEDLLVPPSFYGTCSAHYYPLPVANIFKRLGIPRQPPPGVLPMELSVVALRKLYIEVSSKELHLLPS